MNPRDIQKIRKDFPVLSTKMNGHPLVYLDNAATAQKPLAMIERIDRFYRTDYATVHRGVYTLSQQATYETEKVREKCRHFLNADKTSEILFVRGTTEAINLAAFSFGEAFIREGDEIVISAIEHHANIIPWQQVCEKKKAVLRVIPVNDRGELILEEYEKMLSPKTKMVAVTHMSNALGTVNPVKKMIESAHRAGAAVLLDGAQSTAHVKIDVQDLDCDFFAFSFHKLYGPSGLGVLYGKEKYLEQMPPYQTGGEMIESVSFEKTTFAKPPHRFEAGTPAIADIIGAGAVLEYLEAIGWDWIERHERDLLEYAVKKMSEIPEIRFIGTAKEKAGLISFLLGDIHPHDIGTILDQEGICIRTGHHCAQPVMVRFGVPATARASFAFYNTPEEIDRLCRGLEKVRSIFK